MDNCISYRIHHVSCFEHKEPGLLYFYPGVCNVNLNVCLCCQWLSKCNPGNKSAFPILPMTYSSPSRTSSAMLSRPLLWFSCSGGSFLDPICNAISSSLGHQFNTFPALFQILDLLPAEYSMQAPSHSGTTPHSVHVVHHRIQRL